VFQFQGCGQSGKASKTVNCSKCVAPVGSFPRLPDFRLQQSYVSFRQAADMPPHWLRPR
jgi:hypothetical protein